MSVRTLLPRLGIALTAAVLGLAVPAAATAEPPAETTETTQPSPPSIDPEAQPAEQPRSVHDLTMTATFDKPSYRTGEKMTITMTVANTGTQPVTARLVDFAMDENNIRVDRVNPFELGIPFPLAGGESVTHTVTGGFGDPAFTTATLDAWLSDETVETVESVPFSFSVPVVPTFTRVTGIVYYDENRNRQFDDGEGQESVTLSWYSMLYHSGPRTVTTDKTGRFTMNDVPTGPYEVVGEGLGGLQVGYQSVVVETGMDDLLIRGVAPVSGLVADVKFTKDVYAKDESPTVRVTLTNTSDHMLSEIVASCNRGGLNTGLTGRNESWGALAGNGVDIAPHSTMVIYATEPMPEGAYDHGFVRIECEFRHPEVDSSYNPRIYDSARVPGQRTDLEGAVVNEAAGDTGVGGARVVLIPENDCVITAETTSGPDGRFTFRRIPVDIYQVYVFPPAGFRVMYQNPGFAAVIANNPDILYIELEPGAEPPPALPACRSGNSTSPTTPPATSATTPAPQGARAPTLADTGASIATPGIIGLLVLLAGTCLVLLTRRRAKEN